MIFILELLKAWFTVFQDVSAFTSDIIIAPKDTQTVKIIFLLSLASILPSFFAVRSHRLSTLEWISSKDFITLFSKLKVIPLAPTGLRVCQFWNNPLFL